MVEWKLIRFTKVEGEGRGNDRMRAFNIDLNISDIRKTGNDLRVDFSHRVDYGDDVGFIMLSGFLLAGGKPSELRDIQDKWADKKLPPGFASDLTNAIMFNCEVNGVLVTRVLNMPAPVVPPQIGMRS